MNRLFKLPKRGLLQLRIFEPNRYTAFGISVQYKKQYWGTGFEFDITLFRYHILCITICTHRKENNVRR